VSERPRRLPGYRVERDVAPVQARAEPLGKLDPFADVEVRIAILRDCAGRLPPRLSLRRYRDGAPGPRVEIRTAGDVAALREALTRFEGALAAHEEREP